MLNGRNNKTHDFTSISSKGSAVVDYCFVSQDEIDMFSDFSVIRVTDLINSCGIISSVASAALPDHSLLSWSILLENDLHNVATQDTESSCFTKYDYTNIPAEFMLDTDTLFYVNQTIMKIESSFQTQLDIDNVYEDWCDIVKHNMGVRLPSKTIKLGVCNKKRRPGKPWW